MSAGSFDIAVVGAGIVGLATALALSKRHAGLRIAVLEKETDVGLHQTGHNSGVVHSGVYYRPGSLKARLCTEGARRMIAFCEEHDIAHERCGKVIVATTPAELPMLHELYRRGTENGVPGLRIFGNDELAEIEPHASGIAALHSPATAIVDYRSVAGVMANVLRARGVDILIGFPVGEIASDPGGITLSGTRSLRTCHLVNCAGLYSDVIARRMGIETDLRIVPFRGEYYLLRPESRRLVRNLIYPVPDPDLPFLGVHFTRTIHGDVEAGPNAVPAFAREGYRPVDVRAGEILDTLRFRGAWRMGRRWWRTGLYEVYRSASRRAFVRDLQRLVPEVGEGEVVRDGAGVRAQAVGPDGRLVDDFAIQQSSRAIHVLNAPSPAATASLAIGDYVADLAGQAFGLR